MKSLVSEQTVVPHRRGSETTEIWHQTTVVRVKFPLKKDCEAGVLSDSLASFVFLMWTFHSYQLAC